VNEMAARELGYSREELVGMHIWDIDPDYEEASLGARWQRMKELGSITIESHHKGNDGRTVPVRITSNYLEFDGEEMLVSFARDISEERRVHEALAESEEKFRSLFEQSMDAIYINAPDGASVEVNQAWLDLFGYSRDELQGFNAVEAYANPEDREAFLHRMAETGLVEDEVSFKKKDGTLMECQRTVVARRNNQGEIVAYQGVIHDITNRKLARQALEDSEEKYRLLFEQSRDAIMLVDPEGRVLEANQAWLDLFGYSRDELPGFDVVEMYANPQDREEFLRKMAATGFVEDEVTFKKKDGTVMDCRRVAVARKDREGNVVAYQGFARDITGQKKAERVLRESEARFRELSELLPQSVFETDVRGNITFLNRKALDTWGCDEEDLDRGLNMSELVAPEDVERARAEFETSLAEGSVSGEFLALREDGTVFPVQIHSSSIVRGGEVVGNRAILVDISDRKKAEQQLHDLAAHIEEVREDERTGIARELHDRLAQALTALKLDLAGMKGLADRGEAIPPGKLVEMSGLIDDTAADVRRISSELRPGMLDDLGLVAAMEWQLSQFGERSGLKCRLDSRTDDLELGRSRSTALFRIFQELLTNVARHAGASGVQVSFEFHDGRYILTLADDGRGITEEEMTATDSLGLIGMRERVRPFGGQIEIRGIPNGGTIARVYVPAG
jgi:PAS domain S-box-containing protein